MTRSSDQTYMARALILAGRGRGRTSPNPMVGAVIVNNGRVIAEGYHRRAGTDHAEVVALKKAGLKAQGSTVFVTLEPCCHYGSTGPCTERLIEAGVSRVVYAASDPNPLVNGKGARRLRGAGIRVVSGVLADEARTLNEYYYGYHAAGRPFVILKLAQTLDGRLASRNGDSHWITGPKARAVVHQLRAEVDGVVVGAGTVRVDDPRLTVRHVKGRNPYRIVLTGTGDIPVGCGLIKSNHDLRTIIASTRQGVSRLARRSKRDLTFWQVRSGGRHRVDLSDFLRCAADFGLRSLLIEGGSALATAFLQARLVDKLMIFTSPRILGRGIEAVADLGIESIADSLQLSRVSVSMVGADILVIGYPTEVR